jgi:hypothetical protein
MEDDADLEKHLVVKSTRARGFALASVLSIVDCQNVNKALETQLASITNISYSTASLRNRSLNDLYSRKMNLQIWEIFQPRIGGLKHSC